MTIAEVAYTIAQVVGYLGAVTFDTSKPDGAPRKRMDSNKLNALGRSAKTGLAQGLSAAYQDFLQRGL